MCRRTFGTFLKYTRKDPAVAPSSNQEKEFPE
jgi:hypothetical protein